MQEYYEAALLAANHTSPTLIQVLGFRIARVMIDVPSTVDLGFGSHIIGNVMWLCVIERIWCGTAQEAKVNGFYTKSDHTTTVAVVSGNLGFQQQAAASSGQHCVDHASGSRCDDSRSVANPWLGADMCASIGKPSRGNESIFECRKNVVERKTRSR